VLSSTDPVDASTWSVAPVDGNFNSLFAISCPSTSFCVAVDNGGNVLTSMNPTGDASAWTTTNADGSDVLTGVSCPSIGLCVAVDFDGFAVVGSVPPSVSTGAAGSVGQTAATLNGTVDPEGLAVNDCHFSYGVGSPSGTNIPCSALPGSGTSDVAVSAQLSGLAAGTTYQFRLVARSGGGTSFGSVGAFTTAASASTPPPTNFTLTVSKSGAGSGTVTSSPAGISCGTACSHSYVQGTAVTLTAKAAAGSTFAGWSGPCSGTGTCSVTTNADTTVTAKFGLIPKRCVVPKVKGKTLKAAKRAIRAHACTTGRIKHAASRTVKKGRVISQKPKPGRRLKHGAKVNLVVSKGRP
jgi:hypothetical protein